MEIEDLRIDPRLLERAVESASNGIVITDARLPDTPIVYANPAFHAITGYSAAETLGRNCRFLQGAETSRPAVERIRAAIRAHREIREVLLNFRKDGTPFWNELYLAPVHDGQGQLTHFIGVQTDVTRRKQAEEALNRSRDELAAANRQLRELASLDGLTKLVNRRGFDESFEREWKRAVRLCRELSIIMIDVDHFKAYNDTCGHLAGDEVLKTVAESLRGKLRRPTDLVARYGGEEFVALLPETNEAGAAALAEEMRTSVERLEIVYPTLSARTQVTISLGVATAFPEEMPAPTKLLESADAALYRAKANGRNCVGVTESARHPSKPRSRRYRMATERNPVAQ